MTAPWVFDADGHIIEPPRVWDELLPKKFHEYAPRVLQYDGYYHYACGDRLSFRIPGRAEAMGAPGQTPKKSDAPVAVRGGSEPGPRLDDMAVDSIDAVALYPTFGLMIQGVTEREPALALCRALNDWLAEYCAYDPSRLIGIATLPMTSAEDALAEARRCVEQHGFRGVWRRPEHFGSLPRLQDDTYQPLWSYLEAVDVPFGIHPGMSGLVPFDELQGRFDDYYTPLHAAHFVTEQVLALTTFVAYGILERHPRLRVAFLETGAVWALSYLHRLDEHLELFGFDRGALTMDPSDYFRRQCFVSVEEVEPGLAAMVEAYPDSVVFASDYPHADGTFPGSTADLLATDELTEADVQRVLRDNARRLYGLDSVSDMTVFEAINGLRATRVYDDRPIPNDVLAEILTATTRACSAGNTQPWEFVLVTDREVKTQLKTMLSKAWVTVDQRRAQPPEQLIDGAGRPVTGHAAIENIDRVAAIVFVFWNPDRGIRMKGEYEENPDGTLRALTDFPGGRGASLFQACQNMMLAAHALGVSSLFTTFFGLCQQEVKAVLHVPARMFLESAVFLGYGAEQLGNPRRKPLEEVVHLNDWNGAYLPGADGEPQ